MYNKWLDISEGMCAAAEEALAFFHPRGRGFTGRTRSPAAGPGCQLRSAAALVYFTKVFLGRSGDEVNSLGAVIGLH